MKFMLMLNGSRNGFEEYMAWPKELLMANAAFMQQLNAKLKAAGELVLAEGLSAPPQAKLVHAGRDGKPVTDGVFPESKEYLAGFWIVDVESAERAYEIAAEASTAPGRPTAGKPRLEIEVREVMSGRPKTPGEG
jgi:hypothetical protein